ncbi:hypothetical protein K439DRAFT_1621563 [Ramaria rubella]|nr:hypothetical protein K439DRAFT_1621563 [Ramaria rubella]
MLNVLGCLLKVWLASKGFALALSSNAGGIPGVTREQQHVRRRAISELGIGGDAGGAGTGAGEYVATPGRGSTKHHPSNPTPPTQRIRPLYILPPFLLVYCRYTSTSVTFNDALPTSTPHEGSTRTTAHAPVPPALPTRIDTEPQSDTDPEVIPAQAMDSVGVVGDVGGVGMNMDMLLGGVGRFDALNRAFKRELVEDDLAICMGTQRDMVTGALEGVHQDLTPQATFVSLPDVPLQHMTVPHRQHGFAVPPLSGHPVPMNPAHLPPLPGPPHTRPTLPIATTTTTATATIPPTHPPTTTVNPALPQTHLRPHPHAHDVGPYCATGMNATCMGVPPPRKEHSSSGGGFFKALAGATIGQDREKTAMAIHPDPVASTSTSTTASTPEPNPPTSSPLLNPVLGRGHVVQHVLQGQEPWGQ